MNNNRSSLTRAFLGCLVLMSTRVQGFLIFHPPSSPSHRMTLLASRQEEDELQEPFKKEPIQYEDVLNHKSPTPSNQPDTSVEVKLSKDDKPESERKSSKYEDAKKLESLTTPAAHTNYNDTKTGKKSVKEIPLEETKVANSKFKEGDYVPHTSISTPAGPLWEKLNLGDDDLAPKMEAGRKKRVLVLCTGGTLTMARDPLQDNALAPVPGALQNYLSMMPELHDNTNMPEVVAHEYSPLIDSSDMGPGDWAVLASDIGDNYFMFDGFVILTGTDTMAYAASALSFMLENLGKPVILTGSQIPLVEPYNDARKNLIMALIFACRDNIHEVTIFFHDRLLRACRSTKVNTARLLAFDSPNMEPLALTGITIDENDLFRPPPKWRFRVHTNMETRLVTLRLVPGFDDAMMAQMIRAARETHLKGLVLQLYGTGNLPSLKEDFVNVLAEAVDAGVCVVACTQCFTGSVMMGHYATGRALKRAGVVSALDMTVEATNTKLAYLLGRDDLSLQEVRSLMEVNLRGELTPLNEMSTPPLSSAYQQAIQRQMAVPKDQPRGVVPY